MSEKQQMKTVELEELAGRHSLTGVDTYNKQIKAEWGNSFEDSQHISFELDGVTYTAIENPEDGYRSSMSDIGISEYSVKNKFPPVEVIGVLDGDDKDFIEFVNVTTGKAVLAVGTDYSDDYYPSFIANFYPENIGIVGA